MIKKIVLILLLFFFLCGWAKGDSKGLKKELTPEQREMACRSAREMEKYWCNQQRGHNTKFFTPQRIAEKCAKARSETIRYCYEKKKP
jgi:hypothetical protein